jgi:hypothetical protein
LGNVGCAIKNRGTDAIPICINAFSPLINQGLGNNGPAEADSGKANGLGEGIYFDGTGFRTGYLENALRKVRRPDILSIGSIENEDGA